MRGFTEWALRLAGASVIELMAGVALDNPWRITYEIVLIAGYPMRIFLRIASVGCGMQVAAAIAAQPGPIATRAAIANNPALLAKTERITVDQTKLSITPLLQSGEKMRLLDADHKEVTASVGRDGSLEAMVDPRRSYIVVPPPQAVRQLTTDGLHFPARYVTFGTGGATNLGGLFLRAARVPLTWDDVLKSYTTELFVGYEFQDGAERALAAPKTVTLFADGANARIQADIVTIARSGGSGYQRVILSTANFAGETHFTARAGPVDEIKGAVSVHREPGALKLALPSTELTAYGVGRGTLSLSLLARDGSPMAAERPLEVQLSSQRLRLPPSVTIEPGKSTAEVDFRTAGYGADTLIAQSGTLLSSQAIRLVFPVAATVAAVGGGMLGGAARYIRNRNKQRRALLGLRLTEGMLVGVIFVGAAWAGLVMVDMSTGIFGTPFGAFVLAALSGYLGCVVLDKVAARTFKGLKEEA